MVRQQPLLERRRQQQLLVGFVGTEGLAHRRLPSLEVHSIIPPTPHPRCFSVRLLGRCTQAQIGGGETHLASV